MDGKSAGDEWHTGRGYVYFVCLEADAKRLHQGETVRVKVGKCGPVTRTRMRSLQSGSPEPLTIVFLRFADSADTEERVMHDHFRDKKVDEGGGREWFLLSWQDIMEA